MKVRPIHGLIGMLISTLLLGMIFLLEGYVGISLISAGIFMAYLFLRLRSTHSPITLYFLANAALAAVGAVLDLSTGLLILAIVTALVGWDLSLFAQGESGRTIIVNDGQVTRRHLRNLAIAVFLGLLIAFASSLAQLEFAFASIVVLNLIGFACLAAFYLLFNPR